VEKLDLQVMKRDGRNEPLDRNKLKTSFLKACEKRPIRIEAIEACVERVISKFESAWRKEISTQEIGAQVMEQLHTLDPVAYVRYASVYRSFKDVGEFIEEVQNLEKRRSNDPALVGQQELFNA